MDETQQYRDQVSSPVGIHVIADSDTRWKWGAAVAGRLVAGPTRIEGHLLEGRATPNDQQVADVGAEVQSVRRVGVAELLSDLAATDAEIVVLACVGGTIQSLLHGLARAWTGREHRPLVVTGYVGVVYERMVDGLLLRAGADVVLANSAHDTVRFREVYRAVGADPDSIVRTALPFLGGTTHDAGAAGRDRPFTVTFVAQPSVPSTRSERHYALTQAVTHGLTHPDRHVIVKLRGRLGEQTTHVERHHYANLLPGDEIPTNVEIAYGSMAEVLDRTDLCVTVSSTAALEAMHRHIPTAILTDFGVREALGNHFFLASGALTSWNSLHDGEIPKTDPEWAADNGVVDIDPDDEMQARVSGVLSGGGPSGPLRPWLRIDTAASYLPTLLLRNGLEPDGTPAAAGVIAPDARLGPARRATRRLARRAYRVGVTRVGPRVRRWAQL